MKKPGKKASGIAKARATSKFSRAAPLSQIPEKNSKRNKEEFDLKKSKKALDETFKALTSEVLDDAEDDDFLRAEKLKKNYRKISAEVKKGELLNPDAITKKLFSVMLSTTIDLIPIAEKTYRNSRKDAAAYAYTNLVDKAQQLSADLKILKDTQGQAEYIRSNIVDPLLLSVISLMLQENMVMRSEIDNAFNSSPKRAIALKKKLDSSTRRVGDFLTKAKEASFQQIEAFLSGEIQSNTRRKH